MSTTIIDEKVSTERECELLKKFLRSEGRMQAICSHINSTYSKENRFNEYMRLSFSPPYGKMFSQRELEETAQIWDIVGEEGELRDDFDYLEIAIHHHLISGNNNGGHLNLPELNLRIGGFANELMKVGATFEEAMKIEEYIYSNLDRRFREYIKSERERTKSLRNLKFHKRTSIK